MPEVVEIELSDLIVDSRNARLKDEPENEQAAILALARSQGDRLIKLARDIVDNGLDPTTLPAVVPTDDRQRRYTVLEGNRRVVALKALETPALVSPVLSVKNRRLLNSLSRKFASVPIERVKAVLFGSEEEATRWITLRHTGQNEGIGLVEWGAEEKDRYAARHGQRSPEGQIIDFLEKYGVDIDKGPPSETGFITSLRRLINTPEVRERLGIDRKGGRIFSFYPASEVAKGLSSVVRDLKGGGLKVGDIYYSHQRHHYASKIPPDCLPDPGTRLDSPVPLDSIDSPTAGTGVSTRQVGDKKRKGRIRGRRTTVIPRECQLGIDPPRINAIYRELAALSVEQYPNACSVLLRVFVELSVDYYLEKNGRMDEDRRRNTALAKRMKVVAVDLKRKGKITGQLESAIGKAADSGYYLAASMMTFNQYVHNPHVFPRPSELRGAWDELQGLMQTIWA